MDIIIRNLNTKTRQSFNYRRVVDMNNFKTYEDVENLVVIFFEGDEYEKSQALEEIISSFKPLIVKLMMKYFHRYDEDFMQDGIVELIQRTLSYEYKKYHKFSGYIKAYMEYYFRRLYFKQNFEQNISCDELYDTDISQNDLYDYEITSMVENLEEKQCYIIRENVLKNKKLKKVARDMNISYIYAKKIKKRAIKNLKKSM